MIGMADDLADIRVLVRFCIIEAACFEQDDLMVAFSQTKGQGHTSSTCTCDTDIADHVAIAIIVPKVSYHLTIPTGKPSS